MSGKAIRDLGGRWHVFLYIDGFYKKPLTLDLMDYGGERPVWEATEEVDGGTFYLNLSKYSGLDKGCAIVELRAGQLKVCSTVEIADWNSSLEIEVVIEPPIVPTFPGQTPVPHKPIRVKVDLGKEGRRWEPVDTFLAERRE